MSKENAPSIDFWVLEHQMETYQGLRKVSDESPRQRTYRLEQELTTLDFLKDELRDLLSDISARARYVQEQLDADTGT